MNNTEITIEVMEEEITIDLADFSSQDEVKVSALETYRERFEEQTGESAEWDTDPEVTVMDWQNIPENLQDLDRSDLYEVCQHAKDSSYEWEVFEAAIQADVNPADIDEAYSGEFSDDEAFAQNMAEEIGAIDKNAKWPNNCIDWEWAARELMYDYSEANGHYFRQL